ncbi:hypothetical protein KAW38_00870 [Candidatus Micrarchaeota archaeon]|nr:hypothetical protein [Candidatus Micrarchaeota archaeon]
MKPDNLCLLCKGAKKLCGLERCPLLSSIKTRPPAINEHYFGESNEIFVGSYGYPDISFGPAVPYENSSTFRELYEAGYDKIIEYRGAVVVGKRFGKRVEENLKESILSLTPVDMELRFTRKPIFKRPSFSEISQPVGGSAPLKRLDLCSNPRIPRLVDELIGEDIKAVESVKEMHHKKLDNYYITNLLSAGLLGEKKAKRMVPTRWSITATDDMLGKILMKEIKEYPVINQVRVFHHESLHNHYEIILLPRKWEFENFEAWAPSTIWTKNSREFRINREYESFKGRTKYADKQAGAYYAVKLAVLEYLRKIRKQAAVLAIREVYEGYQIPVGVFQVRENTRDAMKKWEGFSGIKEAAAEAGKRLRVNILEYLKRSEVFGQSRLNEFI